MKKKWTEKTWVTYSLALCSAVVVYVLLTHLPMVWTVLKTIYSFVAPVFIGFVIAYILDPVANFFEKHLFRKTIPRKPVLGRSLSVFLTVVVVIIVVGGFFALLSVPIVTSIIGLAQNMGTYLDTLSEMVTSLEGMGLPDVIDISAILASIGSIGEMVMSVISENMQTLIDASVKVGSGAVMLVIEFIIAIYLLADKRNLQNTAKRILKLLMRDKTYEAVKSYVLRCNPIIYRFIGCDLLDALIVGIANGVFMTIAGIPNVALISVIVGVCNLAPTFGPIVGGVLGAVILFLVNPWYALAFLIFTLILQTIDGYILKPKMFGNILDVSSVWILICIIVLGRMFGILGVLLSIPFAAISAFTYSDYIKPALQKSHDRRVRRDAVRCAEKAAKEAQEEKAREDAFEQQDE